jgi:hypothetical protein
MATTTWVQCDHPDCGKWRRVSRAVADSLLENEPW